MYFIKKRKNKLAWVQNLTVHTWASLTHFEQRSSQLAPLSSVCVPLCLILSCDGDLAQDISDHVPWLDTQQDHIPGNTCKEDGIQSPDSK